MDNTKPTAQILGRFDPWNEGHQALFEAALVKADPDRQGKNLEPTSDAQQICIMVRDMGKDNFEEIRNNIIDHLEEEFSGRYDIIQVPNITHIFYGRQIGFDVDRIDLPSDLEPVEGRKVTKAEHREYERRFWAGRQ